MKKIGILTYHHTTNFGAVLQAYALAMYIKTKGYKVEFINYRPIKALKEYEKPNAMPSSSNEKFNEFRQEFFNETKPIVDKYENLLCENYNFDAVICGSDQIWDINSFRGFDKAYFLSFLDNQAKKISYAASFGSTSRLKEDQKNEISKLLMTFNSISVRDNNSYKLVNELGFRQINKVLDPTFLCDYDNFIIEKGSVSKYVLIYGYMSGEKIKFLKEQYHKIGVNIYQIGQESIIADKYVEEIGPREWLNYIYHAEAVFTRNYHGLIFSLIFNKPFFMYDVENKANKIRDLLGDLELTEVELRDNHFTGNIEWKYYPYIDWDKVNEKIKIKIKSSQEYIEQVLE